MEYMKTCKDKEFDLAVVDPPYGIGEHGGKNRNGIQSKIKGIKPKIYTNKGWDNEIPPREYFDELMRVSKNQIIWGGNYFIDNLYSTKCMLVWDKKSNDGSDFADCELAWTSFKTAVRKFKYDWIGFGYLNNPQGEKKIHPTQKPVQLYKWTLDNYAKKGMKILDTHLGSGSIAIACHYAGIDLVGCEIDKEYYDDAQKRFKEVTAQVKLF